MVREKMPEDFTPEYRPRWNMILRHNGHLELVKPQEPMFAWKPYSALFGRFDFRSWKPYAPIPVVVAATPAKEW